MSTRQRILQFIDYKGYGEERKGKSLRNFSAEIGVSHVYFSKDGAMSSDVLEKISNKFPELNLDWAVTGRGDMLLQGKVQLPDKYIDLLEKYNQLLEEHNELLKLHGSVGNKAHPIKRTGTAGD